MKLAASGQVFAGTQSLEDILRFFSSLHIMNLEIWPGNIPPLDPAESLSPDSFEGRNIALAKEIIAAHGFQVCCVSMSAAFDAAISSSEERYAAALSYAVETARELGASYVNHYCYNLCLDEKPDMERILRPMRPAIRLAEQYGITLCLENEAHDATRTPGGMAGIIEAAASACFKTNFDATNYYHAGEEGFPEAYERLHPHIAYVHLKNGCIYRPELEHQEAFRGGSMTGRLSSHSIYYPKLYEGAVNMDGLLRRLEQDGYNGYCVLEPHTPPEYAEDYFRGETAYLRGKGYFLQ